MIKVLQVGLSDKIGGIESYIKNYQQYIDCNKIQFQYINIFDGDKCDSLLKILGKNSIIHNLPNYKKHPIKFIKELKRLNKKEKYDVFHYNMNSACFIIPLIAAKICKIKVIIAHSHNASSGKNIIKNFIHNINKHFIPLFANTYFGCSQLAGRWFFSKKIINSNDYYIIYNAIDLKKFKFNGNVRNRIRNELKINSNSFLIGHVGRFVNQKNHDFIINIFEKFYELNKNSFLLLIGDGPLRKNIETKVMKKNLEKHIIFLGKVNNTYDYYQAMDIFILPSLYEGLPLVGIEALTSGLPCVFSNAITNEVDILKSIKFLDIKQNVSEWAQVIFHIVTNSNIKWRTSNFEKMLNTNYNIIEACKRLEYIYEKRVEGLK